MDIQAFTSWGKNMTAGVLWRTLLERYTMPVVRANCGQKLQTKTGCK